MRTKTIGPPGTGKTTWMINEVARLIEEGYDPQTVVATTFTRAGRRAIREKVANILKAKGVVKTQLEAHWLGRTIHSICKELLEISSEQVADDNKLKEFANHYRYNITVLGMRPTMLEGEFTDMVLQTVDDYCIFFVDWWRHRMYPKPELAYNDFVKERYREIPMGFTKQYVMSFLKNYEAWKQENGLWDFTDFLIGVLQERLYPEGIKVLACDEAQDFSPLLLNVVVFWESHAELSYFIGDYLQALYDWAGGNPDLLRKMPCEKTVFLSQSYRVPVAVWNEDKRIMSLHKCWYDQDYYPTNRAGFLTRYKMPDFSELVQSGKKVFIQHRTRRLAREFGEYLIDQGIPFYALRGPSSPLVRKETDVVDLLYRLRNGETVYLEEMADLIAETSIVRSAIYMERGAKARMSRLAEENPTQLVCLGDLPGLGFKDNFIKEVESGNVFNVLAMDDYEKQQLERAYRKYREKLGGVQIYNGTVHAFKGEECNIAIINPDLTYRTYLNWQANPISEAVVFHVALTRAREGVYILPPSRGMSFPL